MDTNLRVFVADHEPAPDTAAPDTAALDTAAPRAGAPAARPGNPPLPGWFVVPVAGAVCGLWAGAVWVSEHVRPDPALHEVALFLHLAALVAGFGAVLVVDWIGVLWLLGRRTFADVTRTAGAVHVLIWASIAALTASGALLAPDMTSALTRVKLALVLVIALNGLHAHALQPRLAAYGSARPPHALLARSAATALVSQACWWAAMAIGFHNHQN